MSATIMFFFFVVFRWGRRGGGGLILGEKERVCFILLNKSRFILFPSKKKKKNERVALGASKVMERKDLPEVILRLGILKFVRKITASQSPPLVRLSISLLKSILGELNSHLKPLLPSSDPPPPPPLLPSSPPSSPPPTTV